jgi:hypothetical protein
MTPCYGRGMLFPPSYERPQFTDAEEAEHDARMEREERDPILTFWESIAEADDGAVLRRPELSE